MRIQSKKNHYISTFTITCNVIAVLPSPPVRMPNLSLLSLLRLLFQCHTGSRPLFIHSMPILPNGLGPGFSHPRALAHKQIQLRFRAKFRLRLRQEKFVGPAS